MTKARLDGLYLLLLGSVIFVLLGMIVESSAVVTTVDYKVVYYSARCLIRHIDPYQENEVLRVYQAESADRPLESEKVRQIVSRYMYLPTAFAVTVPFALLPWGPAHILWLTLTIGSVIVASFLIWNVGADFAPIVSGILIGFFLANSEVLVVLCNPAGIAVSLCVVAAWCFIRERFVPAGILCLAVSLAVKPQDAGLVWLYFLLAGGVYRKRALQTLLAMLVLSLPGILWVWAVAPNWMQEMHSNLLAFAVHGGTNDPRAGAMGPEGVIDLQSVISSFRDDPRIYNPVSYLMCAPVFLVWVFVTLRSRSSRARGWLALAAISAFSLLPVYHRQYDAKLLLLTIPACALLWAEGGIKGRLALLVSTAGLVVTGDLPWAILLSVVHNLHMPTTGVPWQILMAALTLSAPLVLLVISVFYLWAYARSGCLQSLPPVDGEDLRGC
jgi:hypothetical protein